MHSRSKTGLTLIFAGIILLCFTNVSAAQQNEEIPEQYYSANALYNRKLYTLALEEYSAFLQAHPLHEKAVRARLGLALCHYSLKNFKTAEPLFSLLCGEKRLDNQQEIHNLHGQCLLALDRPDEAERALAWSASHGSDSIQAVRALASLIEAQYRQSKWKEVISSCKRFIEADNPDHEHIERIRFQLAVACFELDMFTQAGELLASMYNPRENTPFMQHVTFLLAECSRMIGNNREAEKLYEHTAHKMEGAFTAEALYRLGLIRFGNGNHTAAFRDFKELIEKHGAAACAPRARLYQGRCLLENKEFREAERIFLSFRETSACYTEARLWLVRSYIRREDYARAERSIEKVLNSKGTADNQLRAELFFELANARMEQGGFEDAAVSFGRAAQEAEGRRAKKDAGNSVDNALAEEALHLETYCLHKAGRFKESLERCTEFLAKYRKSDKSGEIFFLRAENLFMGGRITEAEPVYSSFLSTFEDHFYTGSALLRLAQTRYQQKKWRPAIEALDTLGDDSNAGSLFSQALFIRGDCLFNLGEWDRAIESLDRFIARYPEEKNADAAAYRSALAHKQMSRHTIAREAFAHFLSRFPRSAYLPSACIELGRLYYEEGKYQQARNILIRAAGSDSDPYALYYLGYVAMAENKPEEAITRFSSLADRYPGHALAPDGLLQQGIVHIRLKNHKRACVVLERFLEKYGEHGKSDEACFYLGTALARQGKNETASERFQEMLRGYPRSAFRDSALYELAWCEKKQGRKDPAEGWYRELIQSYPESRLAPEASFELAELERENGRMRRANRELEKLLASEPGDDLRERVLYRLGWNHFSGDSMSDAAHWFETMTAEFPESSRVAVALYQAGEARLKIKEYEGAYLNFRKLYDSGYNNEYTEQALLRLGECAALTSRWKEAEGVYLTFTDHYKESKFLNSALFGRGWALENQGRYTEAVEAYAKVLARGTHDEMSARSQFQTGECYFAMKEYGKAVKALIKVDVMYAYPSWGSKALLETGRALELEGNINGARDRHKELIEKYPKSDAAVVARKKLSSLKGS